MLIAHYLEYGRTEGRPYKGTGSGVPQIYYSYTYDLLDTIGVVPGRRPLDQYDFALETPFRFAPREATIGPIAAIVHCFYPEVLPIILEKLENIPYGVDLFLSTDDEGKRNELAVLSSSWAKGRVEIRVFQNRGRDIGPKIVGFKDVYERYDVFLHLHTKKSLHAGDLLAGWRDYLLDTLLGSPEIARSNLSLFEDKRTGVVFPQHFPKLGEC